MVGGAGALVMSGDLKKPKGEREQGFGLERVISHLRPQRLLLSGEAAERSLVWSLCWTVSEVLTGSVATAPHLRMLGLWRLPTVVRGDSAEAEAGLACQPRGEEPGSSSVC